MNSEQLESALITNRQIQSALERIKLSAAEVALGHADFRLAVNLRVSGMSNKFLSVAPKLLAAHRRAPVGWPLQQAEVKLSFFGLCDLHLGSFPHLNFEALKLSVETIGKLRS